MRFPYRHFHILNILNEHQHSTLPLDVFLKNYFKNHSAIGSKDRKEIAETCYQMMRWKGLLDFLLSDSKDFEKRLNLFQDPSFEEQKKRTDIPDHIRLSFPKELFDYIVSSHGFEKGCDICSISNEAAPITIRINPLKTTRKEMIERWSSLYEVAPCLISPYGITFKKRINFWTLPEFKEGLFEVQDEGSQLLAELVEVKPGNLIMDYCSGSGGKTLAFAHKMENKGQIYLHDVRKHVLIECKKRLARAGIQNAQTLLGEDEGLDEKGKLKKLKKKMDWVLVDVPCSGTGTLRRNPDMKWRFDDAAFKALQGKQRNIFEKALSFLKPSGHIVYCTCSILQEENSHQVQQFLDAYPLNLIKENFQSLPTSGGMDGFYGVVFKKVSNY